MYQVLATLVRVVFLAFVLGLWTVGPVRSEDLPTALEITPSQLDTGEASRTGAVVVLRNASHATLTSLTLDATTTPGFDVAIESSALGELAPGSSKSWIAVVTRKADAPAKGRVIFRALFAVRQMPGGTSLSGCAVGALELGASTSIENLPKSLDITPASLKLAPGEKASAVVTLLNSSQSRLADLTLVGISSTGLALNIQGKKLANLAPGAYASWTIDVAREADAPVAGTFELTCHYLASSEHGDRQWGLARGSYSIQAREHSKLESLATLRVETSLRLLQEHRPAEAFVLVKNTSDYPLTLKGLRVVAPSFVTVDHVAPPAVGTQPAKTEEQAQKTEQAQKAKAKASDKPTLRTTDVPLPSDEVLLPGQERAICLWVSATDSVPTGAKHKLLIQANVGWKEAGLDRTGSLYMAQEFELGVLGLAEVLEKLSLPTYLFLPGFLFLSALSVCVTHFSKREFPLKLTTTDYWLAMVIASLILSGLYFLISGHSFFLGYGTFHAIWSSVLSISVGFGVWLCYEIPTCIWRHLNAKRLEQLAAERKAKTFTSRDTPVQVLDRLAQRGEPIRLAQVEVRMGGQDAVRGLLINTPEDEPASRWVSPTARCCWTATASETHKQELASALASRNAPTLVEVLKKLMNERLIAVEWMTSGPLTQLTKVSADAVSVMPQTLRDLIEQRDA